MQALGSSAPQPTLLLLHGSDDAQTHAADGRITDKGSTDAYRLLGTAVPRAALRITPQFFRRGARPPLHRYHTVLNLITDPDQNPRVLENAARLLKDFHGRIINPPHAIARSGREQVARRLAGIPGLRAPKVLRLRRQPAELAARAIVRSGLHFPLLIRQAGRHTGEFTGLVHSPDDLPSALQASTDHLATEFVDFRSPDGVYRKYRVWCVGERLVFRHMVGSDEWNVHVSVRDGFMADRPDLIAEERALFEAGGPPEPVMQVLRAIRERMELDLFGVDFAILPDGEVLLFEANATMNFIAFSREGPYTYTQKSIAPMQQAMWALVGFTPPPGLVSTPEVPAEPAPSP